MDSPFSGKRIRYLNASSDVLQGQFQAARGLLETVDILKIVESTPNAFHCYLLTISRRFRDLHQNLRKRKTSTRHLPSSTRHLPSSTRNLPSNMKHSSFNMKHLGETSRDSSSNRKHSLYSMKHTKEISWHSTFSMKHLKKNSLIFKKSFT